MAMEKDSLLKGRGAQINSHNPYLRQSYVEEHIEGLDEPLIGETETEIIREFPKKILNKVESPDIGLGWSMNPYQGCEHGCIYCYARNVHQYWGLSAGLDFERKIIVKENAPALLEETLRNPNWEPEPIMFAGNTDIYQPIERKLQITRKMLEVLLRYRHPVGLITKNSLILRDLDLLAEMAKFNLVGVSISVTTLDEKLRQKLEPRTASAKLRLKTIRHLSDAGIPVNVMVAPIIPGLNSHEVPAIIRAAADHGAISAGYTVVRLNGAVGELFVDWINKTFPDRAEKVLSQIAACHGGSLHDNRFGYRIKGEGEIAKSIAQLFRTAKEKYLSGREWPRLETSHFVRLNRGGQMSLF
jgi:DNA repair photolyase